MSETSNSLFEAGNVMDETTYDTLLDG